MSIIQSREIVRVESQGKPILYGVENCKSMSKVFEVEIAKWTRRGNENERFYIMGLYNKYKQFHPDKVVETEIKSWRGKSGVEVIKGLDRLILIRHQKSSKNEEPKEVRYEYTKEELNAIVTAIRRLSTMYEQIETKDLALEYCNILDIRHNEKGEDLLSTGNFWEKFFNWRKAHNSITTLLAGLEQIGAITYSDGKTKLLNKNLSVQLLLNN